MSKKDATSTAKPIRWNHMTLADMMRSCQMTVSDLHRRTGISRRTIIRARAGARVNAANLISMAREFKRNPVEVAAAIERSA